ncbi:HTH_Tnp_Tc3_2 domain-containing protein [Trichonephila clavipes]|nr:HTH_Tnp_Tc3_2 domain-containing protein [Trichonephila clavipes]
MPGKRAKRHFSQLSEFERGLIIGMKTSGCSTRRVAGRVDRSKCAVRNCWEQWTREGIHARKTGSGATRKTMRRENRRIVRQALVDSTVTRSTIRAVVGIAIVPQTISRHLAEANLKSKRPSRALPLTPEHRQLHLQWCQGMSQIGKRLCLVMNPGLFWGQIITLYGCGGTLVLNELHSIHPSTAHWAEVPVPRHDDRLTRIGHTRLTHRHLLLAAADGVAESREESRFCMNRRNNEKSRSEDVAAK